MASRGSQRDQDEIVWQTANVKLGVSGLDLRQPGTPGSMSKLLNARFIDDQNVEQRAGHSGLEVLDSSGLPAVGPNVVNTGQWVYGHGLRLSSTVAAGWENAHLPIAGRGGGVFQFGGADIMWTGDRLLVLRDGDTSLGSSIFWTRTAGATPLAYGIPAHLPSQVDTRAFKAVSGLYQNTALTSTYRIFAVCGGTVLGTSLNAWLVNRETGAVVNVSEISGASNDPVEVVAVNSNDVPVIVWRDHTSKILYFSKWGGISWSVASAIDTDVLAFDICPVPGGFYVLWRTAAPSTAELLVGKFVGGASSSTPFSFGTSVSLGAAPDGEVGLAVSPDGQFMVVGARSSTYVRSFKADASAAAAAVQLAFGGGWDGGITIASRGLKNSDGFYDYVVYGAKANTAGNLLHIYKVTNTLSGVQTITVAAAFDRPNTALASRAFTVGDETFVWGRSIPSRTNYLVAGCAPVQVCGYCDREVAVGRAEPDAVGLFMYGVAHVMPDPLDTEGVKFTWMRPYDDGTGATSQSTGMIGDMDFLPSPSFVQFGKSVYISGSAVRAWDGYELGDAGFQDYPTVTGTAQSTGGGLTLTGKYFYRVYPIRINAQGERFMGAALTFGPVTLTGSNNKLTLTITTIGATNHSDVVFEVYRTENLGTTFYRDGTVNNDTTVASVSYISQLADSFLITAPGDPHATGVGQLAELEEFGPIGCTMLAVSGDRLWGAGGQVPPGIVQFSKLYEPGEGAGFDDIAGFQVVDMQGNAITSVHEQGDATVVHQPGRVNVVAGNGPDNFGRGGFAVPQISLANGAINHAGTVLLPIGTAFWAEEGPRLLTPNFTVQNIALPVRALSKTLAPTGVRSNMPRCEVAWYTEDGTALLWNYLGGNSRWAEWSGIPVAGASAGAVVRPDGVVLFEDEAAGGDNGAGFKFALRTGNLRSEELLHGATELRAVGIAGSHKGPHNLRIRVYYDGSPWWGDEWVWEPGVDTWLTSGEDLQTLTPAQIDALANNDKSGGYATHKRVSKHNCGYFQVEVDNIDADGPTFVPYEIPIELGVRGGFARVPVSSFQG